MKIDIYLPHFPPAGEPVIGGTAKATHGLGAALADLGATVTILCEGDEEGCAPARAGYSIKSFRRGAGRNPFLLAPGLRRHLSDRTHQALTLLNGIFHPRMYAASARLYRAGKPYVTLPHTPLNEALFARNAIAKRIYWHCFERRLLRRAAAVQVLDPGQEAFVRARRIDTAVICVPNGIAREDVVDAGLLRWRTAGPIRMIFLGRVALHQKGLDLLLEAFARARTEDPLELCIQGPATGDTAALRDLAAHCPADRRIVFREADYRTPPGMLFLDHDVACFPSRVEGFGLAALEAMVSARAVLVTSAAGIASHVLRARCGVVVEPDREAVIRGLNELLSRRAEWPEMGLRGRAYALDNLTWRAAGGAALDRYRTLRVAG